MWQCRRLKTNYNEKIGKKGMESSLQGIKNMEAFSCGKSNNMSEKRQRQKAKK